MRTRISIAILAIILVSCAPVATYTPTETIPVKTSFPMDTSTQIFSPTPTATSTLVPTYTPATPPLITDTSYRLREWMPNEADLLIAQIASNLDAVAGEPIFQGVYGWSYYIEQFYYLAFVQNEALLRFPYAPQSVGWKWDVCYNLALSYLYPESTDAPELQCYAVLIRDGLNSGQTDLLNLSNWFSAHESRFSFAITSFDPPQGYSSSHIITLENNASLLLLEKDGDFEATGLMSNMFYFREAGTKFQLLDLTGDGYPELVLYSDISNCCGSVSRQYVYELSSGKPRRLMFENLSGISSFVSSIYDSYITSLDANTDLPGLLFKGHYYGDPLFQPCSLRRYEKYYWTNNQFEQVETWSGIDKPDKYDDLEFCQFVIDKAKEQGELNVAVKTIGDIRVGEPDVTHDQILYRLGEYHARSGNTVKAKELFADAIQTASNDPTSPWARAAQEFLDNYQEKNDYYTVCSKVAQCDMHGALQQRIAEIEPESFPAGTETLKASGVSIKSNGFLNFDSDGNIEQWLVVQYPNRNQREFWVLVNDDEVVTGLFVAEIPTSKLGLKEFQGSNIYELVTSDGESLISLEKLDFTNQPYVLTHARIDGYDPLIEKDYLEYNLLWEPLEKITNRLWEGSDPAHIREMLVQLQQSEIYDCKRSNICDRVYYLMGLTSELLGNEQMAIDAYLQLWEEYPASPYAIMARSKLEPVP